MPNATTPSDTISSQSDVMNGLLLKKCASAPEASSARPVTNRVAMVKTATGVQDPFR